MLLATKSYAAPEVIEGRPASERSDLYSCGLLLAACHNLRKLHGHIGIAGLSALPAQ